MASKKQQIDFSELINQVHNYDLNSFSREIYLHSHYGSSLPEEEGGIEYRMATQFVKNLHLLDAHSQENILVHLQSPGGDWTHGMAMFDAIKAAKSTINILAHGEISSMSSILFQAASKRIMMPSCEFMIHRGFLSVEGVATTVQAIADWNKKTDQSMLEIYANRAVNGIFFRSKGMDRHQTIKYIDQKIRTLGDWILSATDAVHYGLADGVFGSKDYESLEVIRSSE